MTYIQSYLFADNEQKKTTKHPIIARVQPGDIWQLGTHKLLCGDCTKAEDVTRLMQGERFALCFTSPPYSDLRSYKLGSFNWHSMMCGAFDHMITHGLEDCHILVNLGLSHKNRQVDLYWLQWLLHCSNQGWPVFGWYVWDKGSGMPGENQGRLSSSHEFIFHFNRTRKNAFKWFPANEKYIGKKHSKEGNRKKDGTVRKDVKLALYGQPYKIPDSVIRINREAARGMHTANHPAVFPVALPEFMMQTWSQSGDIVYEPFCGSGTSIIAGENLQRRVHACEISHEYCDVAITRWEQHTKQQAVLLHRLEQVA